MVLSLCVDGDVSRDLLSCCSDTGPVEGDMRCSRFVGDSLIGTCFGDSRLTSCPLGDFTGEWVLFDGNLLLK